MHWINICNWYSLSISPTRANGEKRVELSWIIWILYHSRCVQLQPAHSMIAYWMRHAVKWLQKNYNRLDLSSIYSLEIVWTATHADDITQNGSNGKCINTHLVNRLLDQMKYRSEMENRLARLKSDEMFWDTGTDATAVGWHSILNTKTINVSINTAWDVIIDELWTY